ncbi:hypothetical protein EDB86DRAFT_2830033 [Lactarius hatsudake]|nr:hypothetical protein EDB86DRAFT_2830033 [Lactarius hatsudake]
MSQPFGSLNVTGADHNHIGPGRGIVFPLCAALILLILTCHRNPHRRPPVSTPVGTDSGATGNDQLCRWVKPSFQNDNDALDPPSVNRVNHGNTMSILDRPPQPPSLLLVTDSDVVITGPSVREPDAERTGDHLRHPSHGQYDIV